MRVVKSILVSIITWPIVAVGFVVGRGLCPRKKLDPRPIPQKRHQFLGD